MVELLEGRRDGASWRVGGEPRDTRDGKKEVGLRAEGEFAWKAMRCCCSAVMRPPARPASSLFSGFQARSSLRLAWARLWWGRSAGAHAISGASASPTYVRVSVTSGARQGGAKPLREPLKSGPVRVGHL